MELQIFYHTLAGLIFFGALSLAFASPVPETTDSVANLDGFQNDDDYDYSDDESMPNSHTKSTVAGPLAAMIPYFKENHLTVSTIVGKNVTLQCDAKNMSESSVILWYKNEDVVANGKQVLSQGYAVDHTNFALTVVNATEASQGDYFCAVQPHNIRLHTKLVVSEHPIEAIIPESSKSSQESLYFRSQTSLFTLSVIGIFLFLRI